MNVTEQHLHHMAKRHHSTMRKLDAIRDKFSGMTERAVRTVEVATGAFVGGVVAGRTANMTVLHVPLNLGIGVALSAAGYLDLAGDHWSQHLNNFGDGFIADYVASKGYNFGANWRATGKLFGHAAPPPLPAPSAPAPAAVSGAYSDAQVSQAVEFLRQQASQAAG